MTRPLVLGCVAIGWSVTAPAVVAQDDDELAEICAGARQPFVSPPFARFDRNADERLTADEAATREGVR